MKKLILVLTLLLGFTLPYSSVMAELPDILVGKEPRGMMLCGSFLDDEVTTMLPCREYRDLATNERYFAVPLSGTEMLVVYKLRDGNDMILAWFNTSLFDLIMASDGPKLKKKI